MRDRTINQAGASPASRRHWVPLALATSLCLHGGASDHSLALEVGTPTTLDAESMQMGAKDLSIQLVATLTAQGAFVTDNDRFGRAVAVSGSTVVVGAPHGDPPSVYIFERTSSSSWAQVDRLRLGTEAFGCEVALEGDILAVGECDESIFGKGAVHVFERSHGAWRLVTSKRTASSYDNFGAAVALSGDTLVAGDSTNGRVYIYSRDRDGHNNWGTDATLVDDSEAWFGWSVGVSGDTLIVGAPKDRRAGAAFIFDRMRAGQPWRLRKKLVPDDIAPLDDFGSAVAVSIDSVAVGSPERDESGGQTNIGALYVFDRDHGGPANWGQARRLSCPAAARYSGFGGGFDLSGDLLAAGVGGSPAYSSGAMCFFERNKGGAGRWGASAVLRAPGRGFGGDSALAGSLAFFGGYGPDNGLVYVYKLGTRCTPSPTQLCLNGRRFSVSGRWENQFDGTSDRIAVSPSTDLAGFLYFTDSSNTELMVKILDFGSSFKFFYGQLTNLHFSITVLDNQTGATRTYRNGPNNCGAVDDSAFESSRGALSAAGLATDLLAGGPSLQASPIPRRRPGPGIAENAAVGTPPQPEGPALGGTAQACNGDYRTLCLLGGRFQLRLLWRNQYNGASGEGVARPSTGLAGSFAFDDPRNLELLVKVLDFGDRILIIYGSLSNLEYSLTATDTLTGRSKTYFNPAGTYCGGLDNSF